MSKIGKIMKKTLAIILIITLITGLLSGCGTNTKKNVSTTSSQQVASSNQAAVLIVDQILEEMNSESSDSISKGPIINEAVMETGISDDWHDYVGDIDTFVYGLIENEYQLAFKTFNAEIILPDETQIFGIGYTDYSEYYEREDGEGGYFPAGFLALIGEPSIPDNLIDTGLEIVNLDNVDSKYQFVYAYDTDSYMEHCVIWDQYLRYGIDEKGRITYKTQKYKWGYCDESLGALYSYDEDKYVYDPNVGVYKFIAGRSLFESIDYSELEDRINQILKEQDKYFSEVDITTVIYEAKEAMDAYLLSLQEETFMGCSVAEILRIAATLNPEECIRFTPDGLIQVNMLETPPREPEALTKWLTGICCGTAVVACIAATVFIPAVGPAAASISAAAAEAFMEVVIQNHAVEDINWQKVAIAAATAAALAWACPLMASKATTGITNALGQNIGAEAATQIGKLSGYGILTFSNAVSSGAAASVFKIIDGGTKEEALNAFFMGAAIGAACTVVAVPLAKAVSASVNAVANKFPNSWLVKKAAAATAFIGKHQVKLFDGKYDSILIPKSINEAAEAAGYQLKLQQVNDEQLIMRIDQLPSAKNENFIITDADGNVLTKDALRKNGGVGEIRLRDSCDSQIREVFEQNNVTKLEVRNGSPDFGPISKAKTNIEITPNREVNFDETCKKLLDEWIDDPSSIPPEFQKKLDDIGTSIYDISDGDLQSFLSDLQWTIHEGIDNTVYLVPRIVHSRLSHGGGVALAIAQESIKIANTFFRELHDSVATGIAGTLIIEGAQ